MASVRDGIPNDIWAEAEACFHAPKVPGGLFSENYVRPIALAILRERLTNSYLSSEADAGYAIVLRLLRELRDYAAAEITRAGAHTDSIWTRVADVLPPEGTASCPTCNGTGWQGGNATFGTCDDCGGKGYLRADVPDGDGIHLRRQPLPLRKR